MELLHEVTVGTFKLKLFDYLYGEPQYEFIGFLLNWWHFSRPVSDVMFKHSNIEDKIDKQ